MSQADSINHFQATVSELFSFLVWEYGFRQLPPEPHHVVKYESEVIGIEIRGVSWGTATEVHIRPLKEVPVSQFAAVPLWSIIRLHRPELYQAFSSTQGQHPQAEASAKILRSEFSALLAGDTSCLSSPRAFLEQRVKEAQNGRSSNA